METPIVLGVSACLLGENVRYNGGHSRDHFTCDTLSKYVRFVPVCPEVECGFPIPRKTFRLVGSPDTPRFVTSKTGEDYTERMLDWCSSKVKALEKEDLCGFIFKKQITADEKQELVETVENYRKAYVPLIVPITLLSHYVRKYDQPHPRDQFYLNPHPMELQLRNHA